jgi:ethanolamine permease
VSPVGVIGALVAAAVALATLAVLFRNADYNKGVLGAAAWLLLGLAYYVLYARKRLVLAPEEKSAFAHRREKPPA